MTKTNTSQRYNSVDDLLAARPYLEASKTGREISDLLGWGIRRANKCVDLYRYDQTLRSLQESGKAGNTAPDLSEAPVKSPVSEYFEDVQLNLKPNVVNRLIVAQASPGKLFEEFMLNLTVFGYNRGAELIVGCRRQDEARPDKFAAPIRDYLISSRIRVNDNLLIVTDAGRTLTSTDPLSHLKSMNGGKDVIVCHPHLAMESIARMACDDPSTIWSTGSINIPNHDDTTIAGIEALRLAQCQALLVEIDVDGAVFIHQLKPDRDGNFQHLDTLVHNGLTYPNQRVKTIHWADLHTNVMSHTIGRVSFGYDSATGETTGLPNLLDRLQPEYQYFDDLLDFSYRSKFSNTATERARQYHLGQGSVRDEFTSTAKFINSCRRPWSTIRKVEDNHGRRFIDWLEGDSRRDPLPDNVMFWAEMLVAKHRMIRDDPEDFRSAYLEHEAFLLCGLEQDIEFIYRGTSSKVLGVEHGIHFHQGINGSPGKAAQFRALGYPVVGGHPHTPSINDGVVSVGTCSELKERWDPDCTTKAHAHAIQYPNGQVVLLMIKPDGRYEAQGPSFEISALAA